MRLPTPFFFSIDFYSIKITDIDSTIIHYTLYARIRYQYYNNFFSHSSENSITKMTKYFMLLE